MTSSFRTILCADDDPDDRDLICNTITQVDRSVKVEHVSDGLEAMDYLSRAKEKDTLPCLVILDINMPRMDGKQTLVSIKKDVQLSHVPVVVLSTSASPLDHLFCKRYGVELVTKPSTMSNMEQEVKRLLQHCAVA